MTKIKVVGRECEVFEVKAYPLEIEGFPNLFLHRPISGSAVWRKYWHVSESTTGQRVAEARSPGWTRENMRTYTEGILKSIGREKFLYAVEQGKAANKEMGIEI